jgi:hypothetical protein
MVPRQPSGIGKMTIEPTLTQARVDDMAGHDIPPDCLVVGVRVTSSVDSTRSTRPRSGLETSIRAWKSSAWTGAAISHPMHRLR